jgi:arsenate reductase (thioredoxin)
VQSSQPSRTVLFLCPHAAAKSVMATAYFRRLAAQRGLDVGAAFAGTEPDAALLPAVVDALRSEGVDVPAERPRHVTPEDLGRASRIVSLGCDVNGLVPSDRSVEQWDAPSAVQDLEASRAAIRERVGRLVDELERGEGVEARG